MAKNGKGICRYGRGLKGILPLAITLILAVSTMLLYCSSLWAQELTASFYSISSLKAEGTWKYSKGVMANGRQFSDDGLTAACNSFPLGTKVKVTRTDTKASVVVLVTDRTAKRFKGVRIDLSKAAFMRLADCKQGIIKNVIVERIN